MFYFLPVFKWILYSTFIGSILAFVIFTFKLLFKNKLGARWHYCVWLLLIIKLLVPYSPKSQLSIFNILNLSKIKIAEINTASNHNIVKPDIKISKQKPIYVGSKIKSHIPQNNTTVNNSIKKSNFYNYLIKSNDNSPLYFILAYILWLTGVILLTIYTITTNLKFYFKIKKEPLCVDENIVKILNMCKTNMKLHAKITIVNTNLIKTPAILGCIHPKLLLPICVCNQINLKELQYVILHELAHLKRNDIVVNCITCVLQILHWFNPIIWYSFYNMRQDKELACDSLALSYIDEDECIHYGKTIIKLLEYYQKSNSICGMACIINNKSKIKRRITMISLFKKGSYKWSPIPLLILLVMSFALLTNGKNTQALASNKNVEQKSNNKASSIVEYDIKGKHFKGKMLVIPNPEKISVGFNKQSSKVNKTTSEIAKENNAICAINAGGFVESSDGNSILPKGIIIHNGNVIYDDINNKKAKTEIVGFNNDGKLIVGRHSLSELKEMNVKEAVSFGPALVVNGQPAITEGNGGWGIAPRTAIGQRADGTVLLITVDGRSIKSIGASLLELQNLLIENGAVNASNLDGGSSSTMYYNGNVINSPSSSKGERIVSSTFMVLP